MASYNTSNSFQWMMLAVSGALRDGNKHVVATSRHLWCGCKNASVTAGSNIMYHKLNFY